MVFELTPKLEGEILQALENQEQTFLVDSENAVLVPADRGLSGNEDSFYALPEWNSSQGFSLREEFVSTLHPSIAKDELQRILHSGRGVFRSFKESLKEFPEVEKLWHQFKNRQMHRYITEWYNSLREIWGLETLDQEPEDTCDLLNDDFQFQEYNNNDYSEILGYFDYAGKNEFHSDIQEELNETIFDLWQQQFENGGRNGQTGIVCRSLTEEFIGCITAAPLSKKTDKTMIITSFYVLGKFRGLGIGTQLISEYMDVLKAHGKKWIMLTAATSESMEKLFLSSGFKKDGTCYYAKIQ